MALRPPFAEGLPFRLLSFGESTGLKPRDMGQKAQIERSEPVGNRSATRTLRCGGGWPRGHATVGPGVPRAFPQCGPSEGRPLPSGSKTLHRLRRERIVPALARPLRSAGDQWPPTESTKGRQVEPPRMLWTEVR